MENWHVYSAEIPCGSNISSKSLYLARFSRYKHFYVLQFCEKFENSKWPPFFATNFFLKIGMATLQRYPVGKKFRRNHYLAQFSRYKHFYVLQFLRKIQKFKMATIFGKKIFFENWHGYSAEIPYGSKILSKSLYLARFSRYKHFYVLQFLRKIRKFKMAAIFGETKFFENWDNYSAEIPCGSKISSKSLYLARFSRYKHFCVFLIWKIHND